MTLDAPGSVFLAEIREQPDALRRLLEHRDEYEEVAREAVAREPHVVRLVGHGSSDNAASYGVYAFGLQSAWTALRDSISLSVYYGAELDLQRSVVIGLSQSGRTPDVVAYVARARERGAFTVAVTNELGSELALAADATLPLAAGSENAVAASKTYTNQIAALLLLAGAVSGRGAEIAAGIEQTASLMEDALPGIEHAVDAVATAFAYVGRMYVIGRGHRVRHRAGGRAEADRDVPGRRRASDLDRSRARADRRTRSAVPRLDDRLARRDPACCDRRGQARPGDRRDARRERERCFRDRGRGLHAPGSRSRRSHCSRRSSRSCRASSSRRPWRWLAASTRTAPKA